MRPWGVLMGWKILLEAVQFILKEYGPVASHGDPFRDIFEICYKYGVSPVVFFGNIFQKTFFLRILSILVIFVTLLHDPSLQIDFDRIFTSSWSKSEFISGSRGSSQSGVIECSSEPPFHTCRGPG